MLGSEQVRFSGKFRPAIKAATAVIGMWIFSAFLGAGISQSASAFQGPDVLAAPIDTSNGLVAWFNFEDPTDPGRDATGLHNAIEVVRVTSTPGRVGLAGSFERGWMQLPDTPLLDLLATDFTLAIWVKSADLTNRHFFTKANPVHHRYGLSLFPSDRVAFGFLGGATGLTISNTSVFDGDWHHLVGVKRGLQTELWIDGTLEDAGVITISFQDDGAFAIGRDGQCCEFFTGLLDEAKIWNRSLSEREIRIESGNIKVAAIDIKPGSDPNSINPRSNGVVPVAILGAADFDVTTVDAASVTLGGAFKAHDNAPMGHLEDVNRDGLTDMVLHFSTQEIELDCDATELTLEGQLLDGTPIIGTDSVEIKRKCN